MRLCQVQPKLFLVVLTVWVEILNHAILDASHKPVCGSTLYVKCSLGYMCFTRQRAAASLKSRDYLRGNPYLNLNIVPRLDTSPPTLLDHADPTSSRLTYKGQLVWASSGQHNFSATHELYVNLSLRRPALLVLYLNQNL
jgi:hypothetical protein